MMKMKSNYHTHTYLCRHAEGKPIDYVKIANDFGYHTIGITDHGPLIQQIKNQIISRRMSFSEYYDLYLPQLEEAKKAYPNIHVLKGLELEYFEEMKEYYPKFLEQLDYLVLGQHFIHHQNKIVSIYSDEIDAEAIKSFEKGVIKAIETGYFKILAHPDLYCWSYNRWDETAISVAKSIISTAIKNNVYLEINANGIRNCNRKEHKYLLNNGHVSYSYPKYEFWKLAKEMDAKVIIDDDAHFFKHMNDNATQEAIKLAEELQIEILNKIDL